MLNLSYILHRGRGRGRHNRNFILNFINIVLVQLLLLFQILLRQTNFLLFFLQIIQLYLLFLPQINLISRIWRLPFLHLYRRIPFHLISLLHILLLRYSTLQIPIIIGSIVKNLISILRSTCIISVTHIFKPIFKTTLLLLLLTILQIRPIRAHRPRSLYRSIPIQHILDIPTLYISKAERSLYVIRSLQVIRCLQ